MTYNQPSFGKLGQAALVVAKLATVDIFKAPVGTVYDHPTAWSYLGRIKPGSYKNDFTRKFFDVYSGIPESIKESFVTDIEAKLEFELIEPTSNAFLLASGNAVRIPGYGVQKTVVNTGLNSIEDVVLANTNGLSVGDEIEVDTGSTTDYTYVTYVQGQNNLYNYPQNLNNAAWALSNSSVPPINYVAPDGSLTAWKLVDSGTNTTHYISQGQPWTTGQPVTLSCYAKAQEKTQCLIAVNNSQYAYFDLSAGSVITSAGGVTTSITASSEGWYRCIVSTPSASAGTGHISVASGGVEQYTGDGNSGILLWGIQAEQSFTASAYSTPMVHVFPRLTTAPIGYVQGTTNLTNYSQSLDNAYWSKGASSVTPTNLISAPDGTFTVGKMLDSVAASSHYLNKASLLTSAQPGTISVYVRAAELSNLWLSFDGANLAYYNLSTGTVNNVASGLTAYMYSTGNGWFRCVLSSSSVPSNAGFYLGTATAGGTSSYTGTGSQGIYVWGAQVEQLGNVTNYIATTSTTATRADQVASIVKRITVNNIAAGTNTIQTVALRMIGYNTDGSQVITWLNSCRVSNGLKDNYPNAQEITLPIGIDAFGFYDATQNQTIVGKKFLLTPDLAINYSTDGWYDTAGWNSGTMSNVTVVSNSIQVNMSAEASGTFTRTSTSNDPYTGASVASGVARFSQPPVNLFPTSEAFNNGNWAATRASLIPNATAAPNGTGMATKLVEDATATQSHYLISGVAGSTASTLTYSVYAKAAGRIQFVMEYGTSGTQFAYFDLSAVTATPTGAGVTAQIFPVAMFPGWYRCVLTATSPGVNQLSIWTANAGNNAVYTGDGASGIYLWGAQAEQNSSATAYNPTGTTIPGQGLVIEEGTTNLVAYSDDLTQAGTWTTVVHASVTGAAGTAPDGTTTACKIVEDATNNTHYIGIASLAGLTVGQPAAFTADLKAGGRNWGFLQIGSGSAYFDLANGAVGTTSGVTATITPLSSGWFRCSVYTSSLAASTGVYIQVASANGTITYTGDGSSGILAWRAHVEAKAYPTSGVKTTGATATRNAETFTIPGSNVTIAAGSMLAEIYVDGDVAAATTHGYQTIANIGDASNYILVYSYPGTPGNINVTISNGGTPYTASLGSRPTVGRHRIAARWYAGHVAIYWDGVLIQNSAATLPASVPGNLYVGSGSGGNNQWNNPIHWIAIFKSDPGDAALCAYTSLHDPTVPARLSAAADYFVNYGDVNGGDITPVIRGTWTSPWRPNRTSPLNKTAVLTDTVPGNSSVTVDYRSCNQGFNDPNNYLGTFTRLDTVATDPYLATPTYLESSPRYPSVAGTVGILVEEGTTNLLTANQSEGISGITVPANLNGGETVTANDATHAWEGSTSCKIACDGTLSTQGACAAFTGVGGTTYAGLCWLWVPTGNTIRVGIHDSGAANSGTVDIVGNNAWQRAIVPGYTASAGTPTVQLQFWTPSAQAVTFWVDGLQLEAKPYATSWTLGGTTRTNESLQVPVPLNVSEGAAIFYAYIDGDLLPNQTSGSQHELFNWGNTSDNFRLLKDTVSNNWYAQINSTAGATSNAFVTTAVAKGWHWFGIRWGNGKVSLWIDTIKQAEVNITALPLASAVYSSLPDIGYYAAANVNRWDQPIASASFYLEAPTDAQMASYMGAPVNQDYYYNFSNQVLYPTGQNLTSQWNTNITQVPNASYLQTRIRMYNQGPSNIPSVQKLLIAPV